MQYIFGIVPVIPTFKTSKHFITGVSKHSDCPLLWYVRNSNLWIEKDTKTFGGNYEAEHQLHLNAEALQLLQLQD